MKFRWGAVSAIVGCAVILSFWSDSAPAVADGSQLTAGGPTVMLMGAADDKYAYVGSKACKKCHIKVYKSWEKTSSAKAFESLKPDKAAEAKKKYKLDPKKDYTKDESCLKCHTTGFGKKDGYAIPDPSDKAAAKKAEMLEGSGCESCHGPGSAYVELFSEIKKSKRKYKLAELYAVGLTKMGAEACTDCHNDKSPTYDESKKFDYARDKDKETHDHEPLKQREG